MEPEYIKREAVFKQFDNGEADVVEIYPDGLVDYGFGASNIRDLVNSIPAADVAPVVHGWWEREPSSYWRWTPSGAVAVTRTTYRCVLCGRGTAVKSNYGPNCGAKMDGGADCAAD